MGQKIFLFILVVLICSESSCTTQERPNIILIMSDDHAKRAISHYDTSLIETPNIDRLAREGICFENAFVTNAICAPSRAVILTGKYSHINRLRDNRDTFDGEQFTFPKVLQTAGYQTLLIGKWHLKSQPRGFDYWNILRGQGQYYHPDFIQKDDTLHHAGYVSNIITDLAIETLAQIDQNKPFCLLLHHKAPHRNWMPDLKHLHLLNDREIPVPDNFFDDYTTRSAAAREQDLEIIHLYNTFDLKLNLSAETRQNTGGKAGFDAATAWRNTYSRFTGAEKKRWDSYYDSLTAVFKTKNFKDRELEKWKYQCYLKDYLRCVVSIDENIGRLLDYLDQSGLVENTMVIYTSDQGFFLGEHGWYDKRFIYEESAGIPLIVRYPQKIRAGLTNHDLVLNLDLAPTILDAAGISVPDQLQGKSLMPIFEHNNQIKWRDAFYYHYYEYPHGWHDVKKHYGIRTARYKLIHFYDDIDAWELYDLHEDPHEMKNIYNRPENKELIVLLKKKLHDLQVQYQDSTAGVKKR